MSMVIPGPHNPVNIESFLEPMIEELERLERGISNVWDAHRQEFFTLRVLTPLVAADQPARASAMRFKGANAIKFCSTCEQVGMTHGSKAYFPHNPPNNVPPAKKAKMETKRRESYVVIDLQQCHRRFPIRLDSEVRATARRIKALKSGEEVDRLKYNSGINGVSIWSRLKAIIFPWSFPICGMHLLFENVLPKLTRHYRGVFRFAKNPQSKDGEEQQDTAKKKPTDVPKPKRKTKVGPVKMTGGGGDRKRKRKGDETDDEDYTEILASINLPDDMKKAVFKDLFTQSERAIKKRETREKGNVPEPLLHVDSDIDVPDDDPDAFLCDVVTDEEVAHSGYDDEEERGEVSDDEESEKDREENQAMPRDPAIDSQTQPTRRSQRVRVNKAPRNEDSGIQPPPKGQKQDTTRKDVTSRRRTR